MAVSLGDFDELVQISAGFGTVHVIAEKRSFATRSREYITRQATGKINPRDLRYLMTVISIDVIG